MITNYAYHFRLSDSSAGYWLTKIDPSQAGFKLADRFPLRKVISIKWVNKPTREGV